MTRKFGIRRQMLPNQVVAYNVAKARALRGWTQEQAAEALAPHLGAKLSGASFSALERSAWTVNRIKQFSADDLLALSRGFDLPIGYFFTPPPPADDIGLYVPGAPMAGIDPIVLLDAVLGTPDNLEHWERELLAYSASSAPMPKSKSKSKKEKPSLSPTDLAERIAPQVGLRARALVRRLLGDVSGAGEVLERLAELLKALDDEAADDVENQPARGVTADEAAPGERLLAGGRRAPSRNRRAKPQT